MSDNTLSPQSLDMGTYLMSMLSQVFILIANKKYVNDLTNEH